jgi:hypothetical protein
MTRRTPRWSRLAWLALGLFGCAAAQLETVERVAQGPKAQEVFMVRSYFANSREPNFDEKRMWEDRIEERVSKYLREHPELQQATRYSDFRFWRQVAVGATRDEVRALLEEPDEETIDPALMGALARQHWPGLVRRAKEAWVYPPMWVIYFDDQGVVEMVRRVGRFDPND